jgi:hypothetical protein
MIVPVLLYVPLCSACVQLLAPASQSKSQVSLDSHPKESRQCLEAALLRSVLLTQSEVAAKGRAIDAVVQLLQRTSSNGALHIAGREVAIDRFAVAGSVGKGVSVQDDFDIDLVAFVNVPTAPGISVNLADPDVTQNSEWMRQLQQQVMGCLAQPRGLPADVRLKGRVRQGRTATTCALLVSVPESGREVELEVDVLLAPNLAAGAGAAAAAAWGVRGGAPADMQCRAVLAPVLAFADSWGASSAGVRPSYARSTWLTEASTEFVQQAAGAAAASKGLSGRVVTSTIRLVKAWVRRGLQRQNPGFKQLKSFMIELMVLHAAHTCGLRKFAIGYKSHDLGGRYVLDLLREVLAVMIEWANAGDPAGPDFSFPPPVRITLFTEQAGGKYYSSDQAKRLQKLADIDPNMSADIRKQFRVAPEVVHPVDPFSNVFGQQDGGRFELWGVLRREALQLLQDLEKDSWGKIMHDSLLGRALAHSP